MLKLQKADGTQGEVESVRTRMCEEHRSLRVLLDVLVRETAWAAEAGLADRGRARSAMDALRDALSRHLDYEEQELVPRLRNGSAWGSVIAARIADDHRAQRAGLASLVDGVCTDGPKDVVHVAEEVGLFARALERDIDEEEANLFSPVALGEECIVVDQSDG